MASKIDASSLRYPLYLDVPMLIGLLASVEDGIESHGGALSSDRRGTASADPGAATAGTQPLVRRHTEASLFNRLRSRLLEGEAIVQIDPDNVEQWTALPVGQLVEATGEVVPDPLAAFVTFFTRFQSILTGGMDQVGPGRKTRGQPVPRPSDPAGVLDPQAIQIIQWAKEDLEVSRVRDALLRVGSDRSRGFVLTLSRDFGPDRSLEDLLGTQLTVLGKVTNSLGEGQEIDLLRRSALGYVSDQMQDVFDQIKVAPGMNIELENVKVHGPTLQILPLAIFI